MSKRSILPKLRLGIPIRGLVNLVNLALRLLGADNIKIFADLGLIFVAAGWTWIVSFSQVKRPADPLPFLAVMVCVRVIIYWGLRIHKMSWWHVSKYEVFWLAVSAILGPPAIALVLFALPDPFTIGKGMLRPYLVLATEPALYLMLLCGARITARALANSRMRKGRQERRILIVGTRAAARALAFQIQESANEYEIAGFVDDDPNEHGRRIRGLLVLGSISDIPRLANERKVQEIVIAIPNLPPDDLRRVLISCEPTNLPIRILPPFRELMGGQPTFKALREVRMEDLLPRPEVNLDRESITRYLTGRTVLVTGGGGSIGGELCRQALAAGAARLLILGRGENSVFEMMQELKELNGQAEAREQCELVPVICDVRDRPALERVFERFQPQVVFHAAAHKHVPLMEQYPCEAVKNNVLGTLNVVELSVQEKVERFVMVSTDKAVDPTSVMGSTKRLGEMIVKAYAVKSGANMVCVRFGNVLGSRGSVVPTMTRQIRRGLPVTVTDPEMVRYFMTIPEAVQLILQAGAIGGGGEVFILDMGHPVRIMDLACDLIRLCGLVPNQDIPINIVGRRPGEKVREELLTPLEAKHAEKTGPFYTAPSQQVDLSRLLSQVEKLHGASKQGDNEKVVEIIQSIVPNFWPDAVHTRVTTQVSSDSDRVKGSETSALSDVVSAVNGGSHNGKSRNGEHHNEYEDEVPVELEHCCPSQG